MLRQTLRYINQSQSQTRSLQHASMLRNMVMKRNFAIIDIKLPDLGEGTKEATMKELLVKVGDDVEEFQDLCEVFTDKLVAKIPSTASGKIVAINYDIDDMPQTGHTLMQIDDGAGAKAASEEAAEPDLAAAASSDSTQEASTPVASAASNTAAAASGPGKLASGKALSTPAVRFLAKKEGIDISQVPGTGKNGRVLKGDVLAFIKGGAGTGSAAAVSSGSGSSQSQGARIPVIAPLYGVTEEDTVRKITGINKAMTKTMTESLSIPAFTFSDQMDATELIALRKEMKKMHPKLTMMPFFMKALSIAMLEYPEMNSHIDNDLDSEGFIQQYVIKKAHNFSVAIDSADGLVVPNIKNVEQKSILQLNNDLIDLREKVAAGQLAKADYENGTFSVSSVGNIGGTYFVPVILRPQAAIIAIGKAHKYAKYEEDGEGDKWVPAEAINFSISADHRIIDGATAARFAAKMKTLIENPNLMLLNMH